MNNRFVRTVHCSLMILAMLAALALVLFSLSSYKSLSLKLEETESALSASMETWHRIADEKEALQADLKVLREELREKQQTLQESEQRAEELRLENDSLRQEIAGLKQGPASGD